MCVCGSSLGSGGGGGGGEARLRGRGEKGRRKGVLREGEGREG